jgi:hypothetical protein
MWMNILALLAMFAGASAQVIDCASGKSMFLINSPGFSTE